jgi:hypothetical protein
MLKIIFTWMLGTGLVQPMEEQNDGRDLYVLYVLDHNTTEVFAYEHAYEEEILEYIDSGDFEYNEDIRYIDGEFISNSDLTKNK